MQPFQVWEIIVEETRHNLEQIGTAAHLMMEAVDKASQDLEATVKSSTEHLQAFNKSLADNFAQQLTKLVENALRASDKGAEELEARKEDFVERLLEIEQTEMETLVRVGKEIRHELDLSLRQAVTMISQLVEEQIQTLRPLAMNQHENFSSLIDKESETLKKVAREGAVNVANKQALFNKQLSQRMQEFESAAANILEETKQKLLEKTNQNREELEQRISQAKNELTNYAEEGKSELDEKVLKGSDSIGASGRKATKRLEDEVSNWQKEMSHIGEDFKQMLMADRDAFDQIHKTKLERQIEGVKEEIKIIGSEAQGRLSATHKLFQGSLRRLDKKYYERLDKLFQQFEAAIAQESKVLGNVLRPNSPGQTSNELKELLNIRLKARGLEIIKAFKRQVEVFDLEHARFSAGCRERIETVHSEAKDSFEQQLKLMNADIERVQRGFRVELSQLDLQLPQVKEAGHAAALAVMAYKRARHSFGTD